MKDIRDFVLDNGAADFRVHVLDASVLDDDAAVRAQAQGELDEIATSAGGEYRGICRRDDAGTLVPATCGPFNLTLLGLDIQSARNVLVKRSFIVSNLNAKHTEDGEVPDSDADGLSDDTFDVRDCGVHLNAPEFNELIQPLEQTLTHSFRFCGRCQDTSKSMHVFT